MSTMLAQAGLGYWALAWVLRGRYEWNPWKLTSTEFRNARSMCRYHLGACIFKSEGNYLLSVLLLENRRNSVRYDYKHSILSANPTLEKRVSHGQRMSIMIRVRFRL